MSYENREDRIRIPWGKIVLLYFTLVIISMAVDWMATGNQFFLYKYWAPKQEAVRRQVFERTRSFNQGMIQELENMEVEYVKTKDLDAKAALASVILHRASGYNLNDPDVPADLRIFIEKLKEEQMDPR